MKMKPNKAGLVFLLRAHGQDVPSLSGAAGDALWQAMALRWEDSQGQRHTACLYLCTREPVLQTGDTTEIITREELERFGLVEPEEQKRSPHGDKAHMGTHEYNAIIPQLAGICKG